MHTLILGTMPGQKSLELQQYYAHPRNALWPILCALATDGEPDYSVHNTLTYNERCKLISHAGFGLWDVLAICEREGSLDSSIVKSSQVPNAIAELVIGQPDLHTVACNGRLAEKLFYKYVQPELEQQGAQANIRFVGLPSTSPAMASLNLQEKYQHWSDALAIGRA